MSWTEKVNEARRVTKLPIVDTKSWVANGNSLRPSEDDVGNWGFLAFFNNNDNESPIYRNAKYGDAARTASAYFKKAASSLYVDMKLNPKSRMIKRAPLKGKQMFKED